MSSTFTGDVKFKVIPIIVDIKHPSNSYPIFFIEWVKESNIPLPDTFYKYIPFERGFLSYWLGD